MGHDPRLPGYQGYVLTTLPKKKSLFLRGGEDEGIMGCYSLIHVEKVGLI